MKIELDSFDEAIQILEAANNKSKKQVTNTIKRLDLPLFAAGVVTLILLLQIVRSRPKEI